MAQNSILDFLQGASNSAASNVSAPIDGLNWLLRKAGMPVSEKPFLGSDWMAEKGLTVQPQNRNAGLLGEAIGGVLPIVAAAKAPQIAKGLLQAESNAMNPRVLRKESGMFIGPSAKSWDAEAASKAQLLAAKGSDPRAIWSETGTWKGPDGKWRQEIPDNKAFYDPEALSDLKLNNPNFDYLKHTQPLGGVIDHKALYQAYPDVGDIKTHFMPVERMRGASAAYSKNTDRITLADVPNKDQSSSALHEIQHAIQEREGWARGGSTKEMGDEMGKLRQLNDEFNSAFGQYMNPADEIQKSNAKQTMDYLQKQIEPLRGLRGAIHPDEAYARLAGEAEARATQARIPLDAAQRRALFPEDSYDLPINQLIVRGLLK